MPKSSIIRKRYAAAMVYEWVGAMVSALLALIVLFTFVLRIVGVDGDSMQPTLQNNDRLILWTLSDQYERGDIVVVERFGKEPLIKRVIGVPGDRIRIEGSGEVYINNELLDEPYIQGLTVQRDTKEPLTVPQGCLFVMGDNRAISLDSRVDDIGPVSIKKVVGKVLLRVWPFDTFGKVNGATDAPTGDNGLE